MNSENINQQNYSFQDPESEPDPIKEDILYFNDTEHGKGVGGIRFIGPKGSVFHWDQGHKYVDNPAGPSSNTTIVLTESGNQYFLGKGVVINGRTGKAFEIPVNDHQAVPDITFGEKWVIPGFTETTEVQAVLVEYYKAGPDNGTHIDQISPFDYAKAAISRVNETSQDIRRKASY